MFHEFLQYKSVQTETYSSKFLSSELTRRAFLDIIRNIELCRENQENVDKLYDDFCDKLIIEMDENIPSFDCPKKTRKRYKHYKPYWDDNLETLWHNFHMKEKAFLKFQGDRYMKNKMTLKLHEIFSTNA